MLTNVPSRFLRRAAAAASSDWWTIPGQTCVAAYKPIGAADLATSYVNLANPGTYNAAPGVAPGLSAGGWTFNGSSQYLTTGIVPATGWSMLVRLTQDGAGNNVQMVGGAADDTASGFSIWLARGTTSAVWIHGSSWSSAISSMSGVYGIAKQSGYFDGAEISTGGSATLSTSRGIFIGQHNVAGAVYNPYYLSGTIAAVAIYSTTLSAADVAALTTRMAAL